MINPIEKLYSLSAGKLKNVGQANCSPLAVSVYCSLLSWSKLSDFSRYRPSFVLLGLFQPTVTEITLEFISICFDGISALGCSLGCKDVDINAPVSFWYADVEITTDEITCNFSRKLKEVIVAIELQGVFSKSQTSWVSAFLHLSALSSVASFHHSTFLDVPSILVKVLIINLGLSYQHLLEENRRLFKVISNQIFIFLLSAPDISLFLWESFTAVVCTALDLEVMFI